MPDEVWYFTLVRSVCVCLSVTQQLHLTYPMFIRPTNDTTYLTGNEGQKFCGVFSENAMLQSIVRLLLYIVGHAPLLWGKRACVLY